MPDDTLPPTQPGFGRIRFSLGNLLLLVTVVALAISLVMTYRKLDRMERAFDAMQPMSPQQVARQFERQTTLGKVRTTVNDVRYSQKEDAYKVSFSWLDSNGQHWSSEVLLNPDGFGKYSGEILSSEFVTSVGSGRNNRFAVGVQTPSPLKEK